MLMKILGLDYGDKRIGVALGDSDHGLATPLTIIDNVSMEGVMIKLKNLIAEEHCELVVVGWPLALSGQESEQTRKTKIFIDYLKSQLSIQVVTTDERFTTKTAADMTALAGREYDDAEAAAAMLQMYLDIYET